jgi:hypothetical protein
MDTPWGESQTVEAIADGIIVVTTSGHGGVGVSREVYQRMNPKRRMLNKHGGRDRHWHWYEEDCEMLLVVKDFPAEFAAAGYHYEPEKLDEYIKTWFPSAI